MNAWFCQEWTYLAVPLLYYGDCPEFGSYTLTVAKPALILAHQGLGDHIVCNGLYRALLDEHPYCVLLVKRNYFKEISNMFSDEPRIKIYSIPNRYWKEYLEVAREKYGKSFRIVALGSFGSHFMEDNALRLDESFYRQAAVDFENRWTRFHIPSSRDSEVQIMQEKLKITSPYIFLHEDSSRGFLIDRQLVNSELPEISPLIELDTLALDYVSILENASEIHCIESSFAALCESLNLGVKKYAHRYARPEARDDFKYEYTYRSNWTIFQDPT